MDLKDISARLKNARGDKKDDDQKPFDSGESMRLRARMLGVLLRDARVNADRSVADCARVLNVSEAELEAWEYGDAAPSLPQLEILAAYLDVPVSHFWGIQTLEPRHPSDGAQQTYVAVRQRMIGLLLRQAREQMALTPEQLAEETRLSAELIQQYELGDVPVPMHELTVLAGALKQNLNYFLDSSGKIGESLSALENWKHFNALPEDLRKFAANPTNIGFIEIALAFSQMENEKLKRIAVSMLDITGY